MGWSELVDTLRENFEKKYSENVKNGLYDQRDLDRLQNDFIFARSFIRGRDRLVEGADLIHSSLTFRKEYKLRDVTEDMFDKEMLHLGALYFRARDLNGARILWLKVQHHRKDAKPEYIHKEKLGLASCLDKAFNEEPLKPVVIVLDMSNCGLVNMDIDFVKFIITCFKFYFPTFLAAWKIIKAWLSAEAVAKIKFVTKSTVQTYIAPENLPLHMGGSDDYKFVYTPGMSLEPLYPEEKQEEKKVTFESATPVIPEVTSTQPDTTETSPLLPNVSTIKNVNNSSNSTRSNSFRSSTSNNSIHHRHSISSNINNSNGVPNSHSVQRSSTHSTFVGRYLSISPADQLSFSIDGPGNSYDVITLSNTLQLPVVFKVKTTSPEKYKVRPSAGVVKPGKTEEVFIYLTEENKNTSTVKDKFLIMAMEVPTDKNTDDMVKLWKDVPKDIIMEHRLQCTTVHGQQRDSLPKPNTASKMWSSNQSLPGEPEEKKEEEKKEVENDFLKCSTTTKTEEPAATGEIVKKNLHTSNLDEKVDRLELQNQHMRRQLNILIALQISTAVFFLVIMFSYSCFGEELFSRFLALPFHFCSDSYGRKC